MKQYTKLNIAVILLAALLLQANNAVEYFTTRHSFNAQLTEKAQRDLNESPRIAEVKRAVEAALGAALPAIERQIEAWDLDSLRLTVRALTQGCQQAAGVAIGFVPECIQGEAAGQEGRFGFYIYEDSKTGRLVEQPLDFDYTQRPWYTEAIDGSGYWSEPYEAKYLFSLMCSYSIPVRDASGRTVAVLEADVPLRELSQMAAQFYENQRKGAFRNFLLQLLGLLLLGFIIWRAVVHLRRLQAVNAEKERIAGELTVARSIQQSMIPKTFPGYPDRDDVEVYALLAPAREVGGDFYDFLIRGDRLIFCIGDVSGKGVPAALLMTVMRALFRTEAGREDTDEEAAGIVQRMNRALYDEQSSGYFATMFVGVLDLAAGRLDYCNAGHEAPLLRGEPLPVKPNLPVGVLPDWTYEGQRASLHTGDTLFLYTDGLSEARDVHGKPLSRDHVQTLAHQTADASPRSLVEQMESEARRHAGHAEQSDDITLMAVQWKGSNTLTLKADGSDLTRLKDFVLVGADRARLSDRETNRLRLAVEEAVTNVVFYAHASTVVLASEVRDGVLTLSITDDGEPFDPVTAPMTDTAIPADERSEGGLGILFIRQMSDGIEYRREGGRNILTIKKNVK